MKLLDPRFVVLDALAMLTFFGGVAALWVFMGKEWALWSVGALLANHIVGASICAWIDDERGSMLKWANEAPSIVLEALITQAWLLVLLWHRHGEMPSASKDLCPVCGVGQVTDRTDQVASGYKGHTALLPLRYQLCDTCHSDFAGAKESKMNAQTVREFRKSIDERN